MLIFLLSSQVLAGFVHSNIYGNTQELGYYYINLWVGSPPVRQTALIDTGSHLTAFPCMGCLECGDHMDPYFNPKKSSTSIPLTCTESQPCPGCKEIGDPCTYTVMYAEGSSISGVLMQDYVIFGDDLKGADKVFMKFGCHKKETRLFKVLKVDGIMGIGPSSEDKLSIIEILFREDKIEKNIFTICYALEGGYMTLGGYNSTRHKSDIIWTELHERPHYGIQLTGLTINEVDTGLEEDDFKITSGAGTIVDSGTSFTYLSAKLYSKFWEFFLKACENKGKCNGERVRLNGEPHICYTYNNKTKKEDFFQSFPVISFKLNGSKIDWKPESYLFTWPEYPTSYCVGLYNNARSGNVLGGTFMRKLDVIFDRSSKRIGFAESDCEYINRQNITLLAKLTDSNVKPDKSTSVLIYTILAFSIVFFYIILCVLAWKLAKKLPTGSTNLFSPEIIPSELD